MGVNYEIDRIENSIKCLRGQVELLKDQCINVVIILETVEMLEKELYQLKDKLEKENKYYRVK